MQKDNRARQAFERPDPLPHPVYTVASPPDQVGRNENDGPLACPFEAEDSRE
jgi:hypothetical protein